MRTCIELEPEQIQTQMVQKPMLRIEVCAQIVKKRILLVDDSKSSLKLTRQEILSVLSLNNLEEEVEVDLATDGIDAVSKVIYGGTLYLSANKISTPSWLKKMCCLDPIFRLITCQPTENHMPL